MTSPNDQIIITGPEQLKDAYKNVMYGKPEQTSLILPDGTLYSLSKDSAVYIGDGYSVIGICFAAICGYFSGVVSVLVVQWVLL